MSKWIKVNAYSRIDQAMLRKDLLEKNDIEAFIENKQDSAFLLGDIEIYVQEDQADQARELLQEFEGWTRINVFSRLRPVERLKAILEGSDFKTFMMRKQDEKDQLTSFELYVPNDEAKEAKNLLNNLMGWGNILTLQKMQQAAIRAGILEKEGLPTLAVKARDKKGNITGIKLFVDESLLDDAMQLLYNHAGWTKLQEYDKKAYYQKHLQLLESNNFPVWEDEENQTLTLFVQESQYNEAEELINIHAEWIAIDSYESINEANLDKALLSSEGINAFIINRRDSVFLLGIIDLYVEERDLEKARRILENK